MNLQEILTAIKDENLSRGQLENYEMILANLYGEYQMRIAALKKAEALYFYAKEQEHPELPDVKIKRVWRATDDGLELIQRELEVKAIGEMHSSVRSRIYQSL